MITKGGSREKIAETVSLGQGTRIVAQISSSGDKDLDKKCVPPTNISFIDGNRGILEYVGFEIGDLVRNSTFEETTYLIWNKRLPTKEEMSRFLEDIRSEYILPESLKALIYKMPQKAAPIDVLRTLVSALGVIDYESEPEVVGFDNRKAIRLLARIPVIIAGFDRHRKGLPIVAPDPSLSIAENFLYMLHGQKPSEAMAKALDVCLILHADHGLCASTYAARVTTSTLSDLYSAFVSAIGTLKGPLHGGATENALLMFQAMGSADNAEAHVADLLRRGVRVPGFGHRVYKTVDPRATHLKAIARAVAADTGNSRYLDAAVATEDAVRRRLAAKGIYPNPDLFSAVVYHCLGVDVDLFTCVFCAARTAGWAGHCMEQLDGNRLIRPTPGYAGPRGRPFPRSRL